MAEKSGADLGGNVHEQIITCSETVNFLRDYVWKQERELELAKEKARGKDKGDGFGGGGSNSKGGGGGGGC